MVSVMKDSLPSRDGAAFLRHPVLNIGLWVPLESGKPARCYFHSYPMPGREPYACRCHIYIEAFDSSGLEKRGRFIPLPKARAYYSVTEKPRSSVRMDID